MEFVLDGFLKAFDGHDVSFRPRADGSMLITLERGKDKPLRRVIDSQALLDAELMDKEIRHLQRDLALEGGAVTCRGQGSQWVHSELPTYTGEAISLRAIQTLVERRKIGPRGLYAAG